MKKEASDKLTKKFTIRFTDREFKKIHTSFRSSTKQQLSGYIRSVLLEKPIFIYTRNRSFDDFVTEMILLRNELKAIGNNFNQAVKKLHTMDHFSELKTWVILNENSRELMAKKVAEINIKIAQISDKWSQE